MDNIYKAAHITIIAVSGDSENTELPSVIVPRCSQKSFSANGIQLVCVFPYGVHARPGTWLTRGWTYQEAVLSRRRLVFTLNQVYFECYAMYCFESWSFPLDLFHTKKGGSRFRQFLGSGVFSTASSFGSSRICAGTKFDQL